MNIDTSDNRIKVGLLVIFIILITGVLLTIPNILSDKNYRDDCRSVFDSSGTVNDPFEINNNSEFECYSSYPNSSAILTSDITLNNSASNKILPIGIKKNNNGTGSIGINYKPYNGNFDGKNHTIYNINVSGEYGIFSTNNGSIKNLNIENAKHEGLIFTSTGILTGRNNGTIKNVNINGTINGNQTTGGQMIGGIVGSNSYNGYIINSKSSVNIDKPKSTGIGGIAGWNLGHINKSYATGDIVAKGSVGGLVGKNQYDSLIYKSFATGDVTGNGSWVVGGLVGSNRETINKSYATGDITGERNVGGLIGSQSGSISNAYVVGKVNGEVNTGPITGTGGKIGSESVYWNVDKTGFVQSSDSVDIDNIGTVYIEKYGGTPLRDDDMLGYNAKNNMDKLDFNNTWITINNKYPKLRWNN